MLVAAQAAGLGRVVGGTVRRGPGVGFGPGFGLVIDEEVALEFLDAFEEELHHGFGPGKLHFRETERRCSR